MAVRAEVSTATVSRAYNAPELVSPEKLERIHAAAVELGYIPDKNASALRRSGTGRITLLEQRGNVVMHSDRIYRWFYADMLGGIREVLDASMFQLGIHAYGSVAEIERGNPGALGDGVILHDGGDARLIAAIEKLGTPYVCCGQLKSPSGVNACHTDNILGGREAARVLRESGHTKPAHINGDMDTSLVCLQRWDGFREGWDGTEVRLVDGEIGIEGGYDAGGKLVAEIKKQRIDCIFVVNDLTAVGVMQAFTDAGIRMPQQVSIIGYDNLPLLEALPLRLSTIAISFDKVYSTATSRLIESIRTGEPISERIQPVYVEGETVARR